MKSSTSTVAIIAAIVIILSMLLLFNGGMGMENMMSGGMMQGNHLGAFGWMWLPILLIVFAGVALVTFLIRKK